MINKKVQGNLVEMLDNGEFDVIVHGCNCFCRMRSGIAKQITDRWPSVAQVDANTIAGDISKLGTTMSVLVDTKVKTKAFEKSLIINAYTQYNYGNDGKRYVDYCAVMSAFRSINERFHGTVRIGIPMIGAGLAGGNWRTICDAIDAVTPNLNITVVEYNN